MRWTKVSSLYFLAAWMFNFFFFFYSSALSLTLIFPLSLFLHTFINNSFWSEHLCIIYFWWFLLMQHSLVFFSLLLLKLAFVVILLHLWFLFLLFCCVISLLFFILGNISAVHAALSRFKVERRRKKNLFILYFCHSIYFPSMPSCSWYIVAVFSTLYTVSPCFSWFFFQLEFVIALTETPAVMECFWFFLVVLCALVGHVVAIVFVGLSMCVVVISFVLQLESI